MKRNDVALADIIDRVGNFKIRTRLPLFDGLVSIIISQQLGEAAARALYTRFQAHFGKKSITPSLVDNTEIGKITDMGISLRKAILIKQLASEIMSGKLSLRQLVYKSSEEVVNVLTQYKGIGEWTANIFLIFSLGRIDALPRNDLGLWRAIVRTYGISLNDACAFEEITSRWKPYRTIGCWYMWRSLNFKNI